MRALLACSLLLWCDVAAFAEESPVALPMRRCVQELFVVKAAKADTITFVQAHADCPDYERTERIKDISVRDPDGRVYASEDWQRAMVKGAVVVLSSDDQPVDPLYSRCFKGGTLLVTVKKPPFLELFGPSQGVGAETGKVILKWQAGGTGLRDQSVVLFYANAKAGPWMMIANHLKIGRDEYAWQVPQGVPGTVFLTSRLPRAMELSCVLKRNYQS